MPIKNARKFWNQYEDTFHLAWINKNYHRLNWKGKIIARLWKVAYWCGNASFSVTMLLPELLILMLINHTGLEEDGDKK